MSLPGFVPCRKQRACLAAILLVILLVKSGGSELRDAMPFLKKRVLIQRSIARALRAPLNLTAGVAGLGAAWWFHDPVPAIVWGVASAGWVVLATATRRYRP